MKKFRKRSLGNLRPTKKAKERSPEMLGILSLQRSTLKCLIKQMRETVGDELKVNLAGWINTDDDGKYLTVEISPLFIKKAPEPKRAVLPGQTTPSWFEPTSS